MNASTVTAVQVDVVQVQGRYRRNLGDLDSLAQSIADIGLLNPITVTSDFRLVAGERRLEAHKLLGLAEIECHVVHSIIDARDLLVAERDENTQRLEMAPSEAAQLGMAIEALEKPAALERRNAQLKHSGASFGSRDPNEREVRPRDIAAEAIGMSEPTYRRVKQAIETAEDAGQPEVVREVARQAVRDIDDGKGAKPAVERIKQAKKEATETEERHMSATTPAPEPKGSRRRAAKQVKILTNVATEISNYIHVLDGLADEGLDVAITEEEAREILASLNRFARATGRIKKSLS